VEKKEKGAGKLRETKFKVKKLNRTEALPSNQVFRVNRQNRLFQTFLAQENGYFFGEGKK